MNSCSVNKIAHVFRANDKNVNIIFSWNFILGNVFGSRYSRMDQVKFVEDKTTSLQIF